MFHELTPYPWSPVAYHYPDPQNLEIQNQIQTPYLNDAHDYGWAAPQDLQPPLLEDPEDQEDPMDWEDQEDRMDRNEPKDVKKRERRPRVDESILLAPLRQGKFTILTKNLASRIAFELKDRKISQTEFAENVLGRRQGTLSALINRPKDWTKLNRTGKTIYSKMLAWIDANEQEKARMIQGVGGEKKPPKITRQRTNLTDDQKKYMTSFFKYHPLPTKEQLQFLAEHLNLSELVVHNFLRNSKRRRTTNDF